MNIWTKVIVFFPIWLIFCGVFYIIIFIIYPESYTGSKSDFEYLLATNNFFLFLNQIASLGGTFSAIYFFSRVLDKEKYPFMNSMLHIRGILQGVIIGIILLVTGIVILSFTNSLEIKFQGLGIGIFYYLVIFFIVAVSEEVMSRGFILNTLYPKVNKPLAIIVSSLLFSLMHIFNSSVSFIGVINIFLVGVFLALLYLKNMNLSIPIGLHLSWNFFQGPVFGFSVSGFVTESVFKIKSTSGSDFSFEGFGLEGSIVITIVFAIAIIGFFVSDSKKQEPVPELK